MEQYTAQDYIGYGWRIIPVADNKVPMIKGWNDPTTPIPPHLFQRARYFSQVCGWQPKGEFIIGLDFDHRPEDGIDAETEFQAFLNRISPATFKKLWITRSTSGKGYHPRAIVPRPVAQSILRNEHGRKTGDLRSTGGHLIIQQPDKWISGAPWSMDALTPAELDELLAAVHYRQPAVSDNDRSLDTAAVTYWQDHIDELISNGIPHLCTTGSQAASYIRGTVPIGRTSEVRYAIIEELILRGYTDEQTYVLALRFADLSASSRPRRGNGWLDKDIVRIIGKVHVAGARVRFKGRRVHQSEIPVEVDKGGRPPKLRIEQYIYHLQARAIGDRVLDTQKQIAADLKCSQRTIQRLEREASAAGHIKRVVTQNRQSSFIVLTEGAATTDDTQQVNTSVTVANEACQGGCGGESGMSAPQSGTYALVEQAVAELAGKRIRHEKRAVVVLGYVHAYEPDADPEWVEWLRERVETWEKRRRADERLVAKLRASTDAQLRQMEKGASRRTEEAHARGSPGEAWIHGRRVWFIAREWERRQPLRKVLFEQQAIT